MDKFIIHGGKTLQGNVKINGAKNAALPQMAAALLTTEPVTLNNVPALRDIDSMAELLAHLGATISYKGNSITIEARDIITETAPYDIVRKMRASIVVLGPLLARLHHCKVSLPGGCAIGARPVDLHIDAMKKLGTKIDLDQGYINADAGKRLKGATIMFDKVTVTGTENAMMAAVLAKGTTKLRNCAMEPEVVDLGQMLQRMGAHIEGLGTSSLTIYGVDSLTGVEHDIVPDRIETGTYLAAGLITGGTVHVEGCNPEFVQSTLDKLLDCDARLEISDNIITTHPSELVAADVRTSPYPGFPTDMQAQFTALMTQANGRSVIHETIFENRFMHIPELTRMGADIKIEGNTAAVKGKVKLSGASVMATDLRASASLVLAALVAEGETTINRVYHIDRGYSHIVRNLKALGADIERVTE